MFIKNISFSLLTGIVSAVFYSAIQGIYVYFKWLKTRNYFISKIKENMTLVSYHLITILDINPIYETEFESDHLMTDDEFFSLIKEKNITNIQWSNINKLIQQTTNLITEKRKEGFLIPTYTTRDFHAVDSFIDEMSSFISSYYWLKNELNDSNITNRLKTKLLNIVKLSKENPFPNKFLDRIYNNYRIKVLKYKNRKKKSNNTTIPF